MKRYLFILSMLIVFASAGCAKTEESEAPKGEYNIAYVTISYYTEKQMNFDLNQKETVSRFSNSSGFFGDNNYAYYCKIKDWEYGKNDTFILYLEDGRTMQTSTENVLLMYDPDIDKY